MAGVARDTHDCGFCAEADGLALMSEYFFLWLAAVTARSTPRRQGCSEFAECSREMGKLM